MALAADKVVLGTYKLQELGEVDPSSVTIYGVLVDHIVQIEEM